MSGKPLAHGARPKRGIPAQSFWEHIDVAERWNGDRRIFIEEVTAAAQLHDCGKLVPENQAMLAGLTGEKLPIRHEDGADATRAVYTNREELATASQMRIAPFPLNLLPIMHELLAAPADPVETAYWHPINSGDRRAQFRYGYQ